MEKAKLDRFGQALIQHGRDKTSKECNGIIDSKLKLPKFSEYEEIIASFSEEEKTFLKILSRHIIDSCLHNILFMIETSQSVSVMVKDEDEVNDLRHLAGDPLQGFLFEWIKKYSNQ